MVIVGQMGIKKDSQVLGRVCWLQWCWLTKGKRFTGWRKIKLKKKIEAVVTEYVRETSCDDVNRQTEEGSSCQIDDNI